MPRFDEIHHGRVPTHLTDLLERASALAGQKDLKRIAETFNGDPVYRAVRAGEWLPPVRDGRQMSRLREAVARFRRALGPDGSALEGFADTLEKLAGSFREDWLPTSFFTVPVIDESGAPGMVYLTARPIDDHVRVAPRRVAVEDLTRDSRLIDYFDSLAVVLMKRFFFVRNYPLDPFAHLSGSAYRLLFGCQITEGRSIGAAALALFCVTYLKSKLGAAFANAAAPQPGTLITGEIDLDGRVLPVDHAEEKVRCALEEYGSGLRIILPAGNPLGQLEEWIDKGNLYYVSTVDELLSAALDSTKDGRGLDNSRKAVFQTLPPDLKSELNQHLSPEVPGDIFEPRRLWAEPVAHAGGLFSACQVWNDRLDLSVAPDRLSLARRTPFPATRSQMQVILDGSATMDPHWVKDPRLGSSRVAAAVFQIASRIDPARENLVVGFLGCGDFEEVGHGSEALQIESLLNRVRKEKKLRARGPFVRPLREASLEHYAGWRKRIFLLSDNDVPDWLDVEDGQVESCERFRLAAASEDREEPALFAADGTLNVELLDHRFRRLAVTIPSLCMSVGPELPLELEPEGDLSRCDDSYVLRWSDPQALNWHIRLRLGGAAPHQVKVSGIIVRGGREHEFTFPALATRRSLDPIDQVTQGVLRDDESALWRAICDPETACPECGRPNVHLHHEQAIRLSRRPVFQLPEDKGRWLLLGSGRPEWTIFKTGCRFDGISIAVVNGSLCWSEARLPLQPVPPDRQENNLYRLEPQHGDTTLYIAAL
jgi:hypothetical protein